MSSDEELMTRAGEGDMDAFEQLVRRHQARALNVAYRFLGDRTQAEDVAQDSFLKILDAAGRYRASAGFTTYLYTVIWRLCIDTRRKRRPERLRFAEERANPGPNPGERLISKVREAVSRLAPRQRMAIVLKHFDGLSYRQIAQALGCTVGAVDSLLARGRRRLRDDLNGMLGE